MDRNMDRVPRATSVSSYHSGLEEASIGLHGLVLSRERAPHLISALGTVPTVGAPLLCPNGTRFARDRDCKLT